MNSYRVFFEYLVLFFAIIQNKNTLALQKCTRKIAYALMVYYTRRLVKYRMLKITVILEAEAKPRAVIL